MKEISILRKLGLTEYESKISLALLQQGTSNVKEISRICVVPKNKIYESLQSLINKGIVEFIPIIPKKYFIKNIQTLNFLLKEKQQELENIKKELNELEKSLVIKIPLSTKEVIYIDYGHKSFINKIKEALSKTHKENLIVARKIKNDPVTIRLTKSAIKKGAKIRMLVQRSDNPLLKEWIKIGVKIKYLDNLPEIAFSTFDNFLCRLNIEINNPNDPTLWVENPCFIQILKQYFETLWKNSKD